MPRGFSLSLWLKKKRNLVTGLYRHLVLFASMSFSQGWGKLEKWGYGEEKENHFDEDAFFYLSLASVAPLVCVNIQI